MCINLYQNRLNFVEDMTKHFGVFFNSQSSVYFSQMLDLFALQRAQT